MAYFYGVDKGKTAFDVTVASSTQSKDVEVQVNATNVTDKASVVVALENIISQIVRSGYPPV